MKPCILSADDDDQILNYHQNIMGNYGFDTQCTTELGHVKDVFDTEYVDCIHMDINFDSTAGVPDYERQNGLRELRNILNGRIDIPVMVISGFIDEEAKQKAMEYEVWDTIYKWYPKPADYDVIAFDTIKAINEAKRKYGSFTSSHPMVGLNPKRLLHKLEDVSYKMLGKIDARASDLSQELELFKDLTTNHLLDYFESASKNHLTLANYFLSTLSSADPETIMKKGEVEFILSILKKFEKPIENGDVIATKQSMEERFKIQIEDERVKVEELPVEKKIGAILVDISSSGEDVNLDRISEIQMKFPQVSIIPIAANEEGNIKEVFEETKKRGLEIIEWFDKLDHSRQLKEKIEEELNMRKELTRREVREQLEASLGRNGPPMAIQRAMQDICSTHGFEMLKEVVIEMDIKTNSVNSEKLIPYLNFMAYQDMKAALNRKFPEQFVAFLDGGMVGCNLDRDVLIKAVYENYDRTDIFITQIPKQLPKQPDVIKLNRPRRTFK